ncbi:hypothetical protein RA280_19640 [Cupriavidus sp. CV2]|uniref:hypothetical protein n=1 Tax=Cupriavidus ulmosensis TaxID=3065913 RepID=UPI00296B1CD5|nr:hypothetical protein [Cupriavidus sp. CV2]MDW3683916.1 hypothetical protein [Cupriavidus sp. CV2]
MSTLSDRLKEAMDDMPEIKAVDIARACGIRSASIVDWQSGRTKKMEGSNLLAAAELLRVNPWWLATGRGDKRAAYHMDPGHNVPAAVAQTAAGRDWPFTAKIEDYERLSKTQKEALDTVVSAFLGASLAERDAWGAPLAGGTIRATQQVRRKAASE